MLLDLLLLSIVKQNKQHKIYIMENKESQKKWSVCKIDINNGRATLISDQLTFWSFDHKCRCSSSFFLFVFSSCRWERVGAHTERERELEMRKQNNVQKWVAVLKRHKKNNTKIYKITFVDLTLTRCNCWKQSKKILTTVML